MAEAGMASPNFQGHIDIPTSILKSTSSVSFDFGGSQIKIAYTTPLPGEDSVRVHFVSFTTEECDDALQFVKDTYGNQLKPGEIIHVTGINCDQKKIENKLNVKIQIQMEIDRYIAGLQFLVKNYPEEQIIHPLPQNVSDFASGVKKEVTQMSHLVCGVSKGILKVPDLFKENGVTDGVQQEDEIHEQSGRIKLDYPVVSCLLGSVLLIYELNEDGTAWPRDMVPICGRTLLALGSLLTGAKKFDELVHLAEKGSAKKLDIDFATLTHDNATNNDDDMYGEASNCSHQTVFSMAKAVGKDIGDFNCEDLAAGCVSLMAETIGTICAFRAATMGAKQVFFSGGLTSDNQLVREAIWKIFRSRSLCDSTVTHHPKAYFVKQGTYLAVLGCLLGCLQSE